MAPHAEAQSERLARPEELKVSFKKKRELKKNNGNLAVAVWLASSIDFFSQSRASEPVVLLLLFFSVEALICSHQVCLYSSSLLRPALLLLLCYSHRPAMAVCRLFLLFFVFLSPLSSHPLFRLCLSLFKPFSSPSLLHFALQLSSSSSSSSILSFGVAGKC